LASRRVAEGLLFTHCAFKDLLLLQDLRWENPEGGSFQRQKETDLIGSLMGPADRERCNEEFASEQMKITP